MKDKAISHNNVFKLKNLIAPDHFPQIFNSTNSMYSYNLRNSKQNLFVPKPYTEAGKNSFHYRELFSGIVNEMLLKDRQAGSCFSRIL